MRRLFATGVAVTLCAAPLRAQKIERPLRGWLVELSYRNAVLLDDPVTYLGARVGYRIVAGLAIGFGGAGMISEAESRSPSGYERDRGLFMIGPSVELSDSVAMTFAGYRASWMHWVLRVGFMGGLVDRESANRGVVERRTEQMAAIDPEVGLLFRLGRRLELAGTVGIIYGRLIRLDKEIYSAPTAAAALRFKW